MLGLSIMKMGLKQSNVVCRLPSREQLFGRIHVRSRQVQVAHRSLPCLRLQLSIYILMISSQVIDFVVLHFSTLCLDRLYSILFQYFVSCWLLKAPLGFFCAVQDRKYSRQ
jgi:uncharacterized membrane protein